MGGSSPYVGMLLATGFNFAPVNWHLCDGSLISIAENSTLFQLLGTTFGGDGINTFGLPDLRGRTPVHFGGTSVIGQIAGVESVTLNTSTMPAHTHIPVVTSNNQTSNVPNNNFIAAGASGFTSTAPNSSFAATSITPFTGGSIPHENRQPYQTVNWIISLFGVFPTQS